MRRSDIEVTDHYKINEIIQACDCCRLGFWDKDSAYIVPLNFGFTEIDGTRIFYFHGAKEGKKIELAGNNPHVGFELDTNHSINRAEMACIYSFRFSSIIGKGTVVFVDSEAERNEALRIIMKHYSDRDDWAFEDNVLSCTAVLKLVVSELTCKQHR